MKTVSSLALFLSASLMACATGSTAPADPESLSDAGVEPIVLPAASDSGTTSPTNNTTPLGSSVGSDDSGASITPVGVIGAGGEDSGSSGGGFDSGASEGFDAGSSGEDSGFDDGFDAGSSGEDSGSGSTCEGYASPDTNADCNCAAADPSECQNNGCYGGYYCDTTTNKCHEYLPSGC